MFSFSWGHTCEDFRTVCWSDIIVWFNGSFWDQTYLLSQFPYWRWRNQDSCQDKANLYPRMTRMKWGFVLAKLVRTGFNGKTVLWSWESRGSLLHNCPYGRFVTLEKQCQFCCLYFFPRYDRQEKERQAKPTIVLLYEASCTASCNMCTCKLQFRLTTHIFSTFFWFYCFFHFINLPSAVWLFQMSQKAVLPLPRLSLYMCYWPFIINSQPFCGPSMM